MSPAASITTFEPSRKNLLEWPQLFLRILIVLAVFESDRSNMILSSFLARLKDVDIVLFFFSMMVAAQGWLDKDFFRKNAYGWLFIYVVLSFPVSFYSGQTHYGEIIQLDMSFAWALYLRMLYFCLLMYFLPRYFSRYPEDGKALASLFVAACVVFVFFNVVGYFYHFPFMVEFRPQPGRISNGYPTSDAMMLALALVTLSLFKPKYRKRDAFIAIILILGLVANLTASGILCLLGLGLLYFIFNVAKRPVFVFSLLLGVLALIGIAGFAAYELILTYSPVDLNTTLSLIAFKLGSAQGSGAGTGTFAIRVQQLVDTVKYMETQFDEIFGLGSYYGYVEIQYAHVFLVWGAVGLLLFGLTLYENIASALPENRRMSVYCSWIWAIAGGVLITTYLFPLFVPFAVLVAIGSSMRCSSNGYPTIGAEA